MNRIISHLAVAVVAAALSWSAHAQTPETDLQIAEAAASRDAFWRALDAEDLTRAYDMFTPGMQAMMSIEQYTELDAQTRTTSGATIERRVMRITRYDNPPNAPGPGIYIAFDFVARAERADRSCGYIILHQAAEGDPFRVTRTEQTYMDNASAASSDQPPDEVWAQLASTYCPGWQRSWAIQPPV